ncbi:hypothetical protein BIW11_09776 [Tropilaelaps mercedesae]|nr:hypothetical protein BIW11_09776 [Tropilaelaps mercedesae]
MPSLPP